jgi:Ca2+:H+ antiporter
MGHATEHLAARLGEGIGGLLNATFGNAAERIIAVAALRAGLHEVVKASLAGSIVGNILLVLGAAMLAGGLRHRPEQTFNAPGARSQATMLTLVVVALVLLSYAVSPVPMDLAFEGGLVLAVLLAVLITGQVARDGRSDWLEGVQLLAVYLILGMAFFFAPAAAPQ